MKKFLIILFFCFGDVNSQDLLRNGSFEKYNKLPENVYGSIDNCKYWNYILKNGSPGTPDYFHDDAVFNIANWSGVDAITKAGKAMIGMQCLDLHPTRKPTNREYISTKFRNPLEIGEEYDVSFWITNGTRTYTGYSCDGLGFVLSTNQLTQNKTDFINKNPQIKIIKEVWSKTWVKYSFIYTADSAYEYLTFGNFLSDSLTSSTFYEGDSLSGAYYLVDDFKVLPNWLYITGDSIICKGDKATLRLFNWINPKWTILGHSESILSNDSIMTFLPESTTTYIVYDVEDTARFTVYVKDIGEVSVGNDTVICFGETVVRANMNVIDDAVNVWDGIDTVDSKSFNTGGKNWLTAFKNGCSVSDSFLVDIKNCECQISIPNTFTPNSDGINDIFSPVFGCSVNKYRIYIFNRWGDIVFNSKDLNVYWDGKYGSSYAPYGIYSYRIDYELASGITGIKFGKILLSP